MNNSVSIPEPGSLPTNLSGRIQNENEINKSYKKVCRHFCFIVFGVYGPILVPNRKADRV